MGTVFIVLVFISFIITLLPKFTGLIENRGKKEEPKAAPAKAAPAPVVVEEEEDEIDDLELVAVITAAIAASEGVPADGFVVRSIRKSTQNKWKRV